MIKYDKLFKKNLLTEADELDQAVPEKTPEDSEVWKNSLGDGTDASKFDVEGVDGIDIEKYSKIIDSWVSNLNDASKVLKQMLQFTSSEKLKSAPGTGEFNNIVKRAPRLKSDLSSFISQVEDLREVVKLSIKEDQEKE